MALFGQKEATPASAGGLALHCEIGTHDRFWARTAQLATAVATFFTFDWANATADCYVRERCGYSHWFLPR